MFETLHPLSDEHLSIGADALQRDRHMAVLVDPSGVHVLLSACPNFEADFAAVINVEGEWKVAELTPEAGAVLVAWGEVNIPALCRRWRERHGTPLNRAQRRAKGDYS